MYVGPFVTSLDMAGFSLTFMRVDDPLLAALDAPTQASCAAEWGSVCLILKPRCIGANFLIVKAPPCAIVLVCPPAAPRGICSPGSCCAP